MAVIISKIFVVFIYIAIGFAAYRLKVFNDDSIIHLTKLLIYITCPALMLYSIGGAELNRSIMFNTVLMLALAVFMYAISGFAVMWFARRRKAVAPLDANVISLATTSSNTGFMGFPISQSVFGPTVLYYMIIQNVGLNLYMYTMGVWELNYKADESRGRKSARETLKSAANPILISSLVAVVILFAGIRIPEYCMNIFETIGEATIPLSMILVGVQLGASRLSEVFKSRVILLFTFINLIVIPAITFGIAMLLPIENIVKVTFVLSMCFPSAAIGVALSASEGRNSLLYAELVASTTLLSMITLPVWIMIISNEFPLM